MAARSPLHDTGDVSARSSRKSQLVRGCLFLIIILVLAVQITGFTAAYVAPAQNVMTDEKANQLGQLPERSAESGEAVSETDEPGDSMAASGGLGEAAILLAAYTRFNDVSPLEHDVRADIIEIVGALPGLYLAQLVGRVGKPNSTVRYHARVLERENRLQTARLWGNHRFFPPTMQEDDFAYHAMRRDAASSRVFDAIYEHEPLTVGSLAETIDRAPSTVSHHLSRLEEAGLIERIRHGESVEVTIAATPSAPELSPQSIKY